MVSADEHDDATLARRAADGDRAAVATLFRRWHDRLLAQVLRQVSDAELAGDIVQDSFIDLLKGIRGYDPARPFGPWLRTICRNRMLRHLRRTRPGIGSDLLEALVAAEEDEGAAELDEDCLAALRACLQGLDPDQRQLLRRHYVLGERLVDIAAALACQANALMVRFHRLRKRLRACLETKGVRI